MRLNVATRKGLFTLVRSADGWQVEDHSFPGDPVTMTLWDPRDRSLYAALKLGHYGPKLQRREAGGEWQEAAAPAMPPEQENGAVTELSPGQENTSVTELWALECAGSEAGDLWCGTLPGALFRSRDAGASWQMNQALWDHPGRQQWFGGGADEPAIHSICVHPHKPAEVVVGVSVGGVWQSDDDGGSWRNIAQGMRAAYVPEEQQFDADVQDPHLVVRCAGQPEVLWSQHHNGIFRRAAVGADWEEITTAPLSSFGFAVAVHPSDPARAWFLPAISDECRIPVDAALVVNRTRDAGASFESLRRGLPQQHAYDLVFRHALAIDDSGEILAFGSTCGGLWLSEDGGEQWQDLGLRLPPVYCVRFAG